LVDPQTCSRAVEKGLHPLKHLLANDSRKFLEATGDLIITGPTQTNLMDIQILLLG
jgi:glycerate-2-kinase